MHTRPFPLLIAFLLLTSCSLPAVQTAASTATATPSPLGPPTLAIIARLPIAASQITALTTSTSLPLPPTVTLASPSATNLPPTATPLPTDTNPPPTVTKLPPAVTHPPTATKTPLSPTRAPTAAIPGKQFVSVFLIALNDNGKSGPLVGCGDSVVPVQVELNPPTLGVLRTSLQKLLAIKTQFYGQSGLYDALYQSNLQVQSVTLLNGSAVIQLTGSLLLGGECDNPRVAAQLIQTARQFTTVQTVSIFINGITLKQALSLK